MLNTLFKVVALTSSASASASAANSGGDDASAWASALTSKSLSFTSLDEYELGLLEKESDLEFENDLINADGTRTTLVPSKHELGDSTTGALLLEDAADGTPIGVYKSEEAKRERVAYLMDYNSGGRAKVPPTIMTEWNGSLGALSRYVKNVGTASDYGPSVFTQEDVHSIAILDIRLMNTDRHVDNILIVENSSSGKKRLVPIDHGKCLPDISEIGNARFDWLYWGKVIDAPLSSESLKMIETIDLERDLSLLKRYKFPLGSLLLVWMTTVLLKKAAKAGLTLRQIGSLIQRSGDRQTPSPLETLYDLARKKPENFAEEFTRHLGKLISSTLALKDL